MLMKSIFGPVEMAFGLIQASYSNMEVVKLTFFAPGDDGDDDYDYTFSSCEVQNFKLALMN